MPGPRRSSRHGSTPEPEGHEGAGVCAGGATSGRRTPLAERQAQPPLTADADDLVNSLCQKNQEHERHIAALVKQKTNMEKHQKATVSHYEGQLKVLKERAAFACAELSKQQKQKQDLGQVISDLQQVSLRLMTMKKPSASVGTQTDRCRNTCLMCGSTDCNALCYKCSGERDPFAPAPHA